MLPGISSTSAKHYVGHAQESTTGRYIHIIVGQMTTDAALLDAYWNAEPAKVIELRPSGGTGAITGAQNLPDQRFASAQAVLG